MILMNCLEFLCDSCKSSISSLLGENPNSFNLNKSHDVTSSLESTYDATPHVCRNKRISTRKSMFACFISNSFCSVILPYLSTNSENHFILLNREYSPSGILLKSIDSN